MADPVSLAIRTEQAINRLEKRMGELAQRAGVDLPEIPRRNQDPAMLRALQIEAIADGLDAVLNANWASVGEPISAVSSSLMEEAELASLPDFQSMNRTEVLKMAKGYGMAIKPTSTKQEGEDFILAALGITEDEQASMSGDAAKAEG